MHQENTGGGQGSGQGGLLVSCKPVSGRDIGTNQNLTPGVVKEWECRVRLTKLRTPTTMWFWYLWTASPE